MSGVIVNSRALTLFSSALVGLLVKNKISSKTSCLPSCPEHGAVSGLVEAACP